MLAAMPEWPGVRHVPIPILRQSVHDSSVAIPPAADAVVARTEDRTIAGPGGDLPVRVYTPQGTGPFPVIVYMHGGGYVVGDLDTQDMIARALCAWGEGVVISVDYRLAPEHKFPAAVDDSFAALAEGNRTKRAGLTSYSLDQDRARLDMLARRFGADAPGLDPASLPMPPVIPIFVVGMMRSGTTLTEQIISAHSQVHGAGELRHLGAAAGAELEGSDGPLDTAALLRIRNRYLSDLAGLSRGAPYAVDKMPSNFRYTGLIRKALPEARIIHLRRDPVAVCWSNYKTLFSAQAIGYAWDMHEVAGFYRLYEAFMERMAQEFPGQFLTVDYAALTETPEPVIRGILDFCGLPFEEACLHPEDNTRAVRTASVRQVRSGIYKGSNTRWKGFEKHMGPLLDAFAQPPGAEGPQGKALAHPEGSAK